MEMLETINKNNQIFVLVPVDLFDKIREDAEMLHDMQAYRAAKERLKDGEDEVIPFELIKRRVAGENPVKIWREYREMTQEELAAASGISRGMVAAIEAGHKTGSVATLKAITKALEVDLDNIIS